MVVKNRWKTVLQQKGMTQAEAARVADLSVPFFSGVVNGASVLEYDDLMRVCNALSIQPSSVYDAAVLQVLYGMEQTKKKERAVVNIQLFDKYAEMFLLFKKIYGCGTNAELVKLMLDCEYNARGALIGDMNDD